MSALTSAERALLGALITHYQLSLLNQLRRATVDPQVTEQDGAQVIRDLELAAACADKLRQWHTGDTP